MHLLQNNKKWEQAFRNWRSWGLIRREFSTCNSQEPWWMIIAPPRSSSKSYVSLLVSQISSCWKILINSVSLKWTQCKFKLKNMRRLKFCLIYCHSYLKKYRILFSSLTVMMIDIWFAKIWLMPFCSVWRINFVHWY